MKKIKILHCADLHFDTQMANLSKQDLLDVFLDIINIAKDEKVHIMLVAGDIFDNISVNKSTLKFLEDSFSKIPEVKVFVSPGNHDPYNQKSFYKMINWPKNVYIFKGDIEKVYVEDLDINVFGAAFKESYIKESNLNIQCNEDKINLMVIHGDIVSGNSKNEYNPISLNDIENSKMDYIALGHRHSFTGINRVGNTFYAYSGCPQGRGFDECGDKGIIIGDVYKNGHDLKFRKVSKRLYCEENIDISNLNSNLEVNNLIVNYFNKEERLNNLYKINLIGEINDSFIMDEKLINEYLKSNFYYIKVIDKTKIKYNYEELAKGNSIKSIFVRDLLEKYNESSEEEKLIVMNAIKVGLRALSEDEVNLNDY